MDVFQDVTDSPRTCTANRITARFSSNNSEEEIRCVFDDN